MKTRNYLRFAAVLLLLFSVMACEKEIVVLESAEEEQPADLVIKSLVDAAGSRYLGGEVSFSESAEAPSAVREGLVDEYTAGEAGLSDTRSRNKLHQCVVSVEPDRDQRMKLGRAFTAYAERNKSIIGTHREQIQNLQQRVAAARAQLYASLEDGTIDREQFRQRMQVMRENYQDAVLRIRNSNVDAFSRSYALLLEHISKILSEDQWEAFTACMLS